MANDLLKQLQAHAETLGHAGEACPECNRGTGKEEVENCECCYNTGYITPEWFLNNNVLEVKYVVSGDFRYLKSVLTLTMGGPNIYLHLSDNQAHLEGFWGDNKASLSLESTEFLRRLDFCVSEMFLSSRYSASNKAHSY